MYEEINEEKLWTIYLSNPYREGSFSDFKESVTTDGRTKKQIENEANAASDKALEMLNQIGGDVLGN